MAFVVKKCHPREFEAVMSGAKPFEWRKEDDVTFNVGDTLILMEYVPAMNGKPLLGYTGREVRRRVSYVLRGSFGVPEGFAVLGLQPEGATAR